VLQWGAVWCSVLQCCAVYRIVLHSFVASDDSLLREIQEVQKVMVLLQVDIRFVAVCCSVLQCVAVCCCVLLCVAVCCCVMQCVADKLACIMTQRTATQLQHAATHCNTTATLCSTLQRTATRCNALQHNCNILRHTATLCNTTATHCSTLGPKRIRVAGHSSFMNEERHKKETHQRDLQKRLTKETY